MNVERTKRNVLWLLAASARWLASSVQDNAFSRDDWQTIAVDRFGDADLRLISRHLVCSTWEQTLPNLPLQPQDLVVFGGGLENCPELVAELAQRAPTLGFPPQELVRTKTPETWCPILRSAGFTVPDWISQVDGKLVLNPVDSDGVHRDQCPQPNGSSPIDPASIFFQSHPHWVLKPRRSAGGHQIQWWPLARRDSRSLPEISPHQFLQRFVPGPSWSASFLATDRGCHFIGACRQWIGGLDQTPRPFKYQGAWGPLPISIVQQQRLQQLGQVVQDQFSARGLFGIDLVGSIESDWSVIEINPRPTSSMELLERATSVDQSPLSLIEQHCLACCGQETWDPFPIPAANRIFAKRILYHRGPSAVRVTEPICQLLWTWAESSQAADIPERDTEILPGQPVCTLFAIGETLGPAIRGIDEKQCQWHRATEADCR